MRTMTWTVIISLALVAALGAGCGAYSRRVSEEFQMETEQILAALAAGDWEDALARTRLLDRAWTEKNDLLSLFVNHPDLEAVSLCLRRLRLAVEEKQRYWAMEAAHEMREALELIYFRDALSLKNIL